MQRTIQKNDFSQGSIPKTIARMSVPLIAAQIINVLYSIVDRIYIGRMPGVGMTVLAGIGLTFPIISLISAFTALAGQGGAPLLSIARGEGDTDRAGRIMGNSFFMLMAFGVICTIAGYAVKQPLLRLFGASEETFPYANAYLDVYLAGSLFVMTSLGMNPFINAQGFTRTGMMTVLIGAVSNVILDPVFIYALNMGVRGAALATVLSQGLSAAWTLSFLTGRRCLIPLKIKNIRPDLAIMGRIAGLGVSNFTMNVNDSLVQIVCNRQLGVFGGDVYITVMTVISSIRQIIQMPLSGFSQAASPVMGFNYGAKRYDRVRKCVGFTALCTSCFAVLAWGVMQLFPALMIRLFNGDKALLEVGIPAVRLYFATFLCMALQMTGQNCFTALGKSKQAMFFSLLRKAFIVAPLTLILPNFMGVMGVFAAEAVSDVVGPVACFTTFMMTIGRKELGFGKRGIRE